MANEKITQIKNLSYQPGYFEGFDPDKHLLDVYPSGFAGSDVLIFIQGGGWSVGSKNFYSKIGEIFSANGVTTVIGNYRLAPDFNVMDMAKDCAAIFKWTYQNVFEYNGNYKRIFLSGHSAGGHLAALIALNPEFINELTDAVNGLILIDAFGLNAKEFIEAHKNIYMHHIKNIFTSDPEIWLKGSPADHLKNACFPIYILTGKETHDVLMYDNRIFVKKLKEKSISHRHEILEGKSHMQMILQMEKQNNDLYKRIIDFMKTN